MLGCTSRSSIASRCMKTTPLATARRYFHRVTADFINYDHTTGKQTSTPTSIIIGNPDESYVMILPEIGRALYQAASFLRTPSSSPSPSSARVDVEGTRCKLTFFHDSQHFGFGEPPSFPRLHVPRNLPRRRDSSTTSPATLFLNGAMHEITLDGTPDAQFAEQASSSGRDLRYVLDQLKDM